MEIGKIHSFQSMGTVDGPGIRAVLFMQGCPLRCICCHNPDTWIMEQGKDISTKEVFDKIIRCKNYFGAEGGVTVSGGEPLMQPDFLIELFTMLKQEGINTAIDTSGYILNNKIKHLLELTDLVILDYKYTNDDDYIMYTGIERRKTEEFLMYLNEQNKRVWIREVIIPELNDNLKSLNKLYDLKKKYSCIKKIELLPFRKLCVEKYEELGIDFKLKDTPEMSQEKLNEMLKNIKQ